MPKKPPRETSDRVSTIAARVLRSLPAKGDYLLTNPALFVGVSARDVRALAASCLAQDQTKGQKTKPKRRGKGRR